ncbi:MAG: helicase [Sphingomonas sanxanigenens]|uniref:Helicase n=1 Tax=Sphingomonas sanxanigenens TaxID=397260 RepID=A0A2W5A061_9SPHN|nr:MAG: helicase [Sphingomonas sanxanigenens]
MSLFASSPVAAVLGPTNTGKTHLAVERMCGHSSGMIGFPLRLLAREVYDRVVAIKGVEHVALITGEEKILPPRARYFLCTAESMPLSAGREAGSDRQMPRDVAFVAIDEAQLGADPERGHVFTDRLLRARGREETLILGSDSLRPMLRALLPDAEIIARPRFSTLRYAGVKKLSRLPKRSAIVAFSAEEVYAVAEMLRRLRGGAAVVMGALSPRTRNAQVAMFQAGEVDYLVATDAIGMGLNMDVAHVAFASLAKFDGRRQRRLTLAEMAQIAGRAGRHQRDGTFGTLTGHDMFAPEEVEAIEAHRFPPLDHLYWRDGDPDMSSLEALIDALERRPDRPVLRAAPQATDLAVLKQLAAEDWVRDRARGGAMVRRLWAACSLPDFRKSGVDQHSRFVARIFRALSEGDAHIPHTWFAEEIARLDSVSGDVETIAGRIAAARSWAYIAHRADWLADPAHWAERTRALEEKLSDALHAGLTQRFVDRRTTVLMREVGADSALLPVTVSADGEVRVDDEPIGSLTGFAFRALPEARAADHRKLLAAAERRLAGERAERARLLAADGDDGFALVADAGQAPAIRWRGLEVARLEKGKALLAPRIRVDRPIAALPEAQRLAIEARLERWLAARVAGLLSPLARIVAGARDPQVAPALRALFAPLGENGGVIARRVVDDAVAGLDKAARREARRIGVSIGALDIFAPALLKPEPMRWRLALEAARSGVPLPPPPPAGVALLAADPRVASAGFRLLGRQMLRVDLVERIARAAHDARDGRRPFTPDPSLATSMGLTPASLARLMEALGFRPTPGAQDAPPGWVWSPRRRPRKDAPSRPGNAFAGLADLVQHGR